MDCNKFILLLLISPLFAETFEKKFCKVFRIVFTLFFFVSIDITTCGSRFETRLQFWKAPEGSRRYYVRD